MIIGIGVDLCSISRIQNAMTSTHFRENVFSLEEIAHAEAKGAKRFMSYAACFAAREAFIKAARLSLASVMFSRNFELVRNEEGAPAIRLTGELGALFPEEEYKIFVSISHEQDYACSMVVIEKIHNEVINDDNSDSGF